jgi:hypothetical protein
MSIYGKVVKFRSFQTKPSIVVRKIYEQDKASALKHILCSLMNTSHFFNMKMFNIVIIKKLLGNSLQLIEDVLPWVQYQSFCGAILISGMYHKLIASYLWN